MREQIVTIVDSEGQTVGHYPVTLGSDLTEREEYEKEALKRARDDGIPEERLVGCTFKLVPAK